VRQLRSGVIGFATAPEGPVVGKGVLLGGVPATRQRWVGTLGFAHPMSLKGWSIDRRQICSARTFGVSHHLPV
jgi:hypothetical protein